jgi:transposase
MSEEKFVGIDVAKDKFDICVLPERAHFVCNNDAKGITGLVADLKRQNPTVIVLEPSGGYEMILTAELYSAELPVALVNARQVRDFARSIGKLAKTDSIDAYVLARFAEAVRPEPKPIPTEEQRLIRDLVTRRRQLVDMRAAEKNRLHQARTKVLSENVLNVITFLDKQIQSIDTDIDDQIKKSPLWSEKNKLLTTFKGVGPVTTKTLMAYLPELGEVDRQKISSLAGLAPFNKDSGKMRGKRMIAGGRAIVRKALYMAAITAAKHNDAIRPFYQRLIGAGKPAKVALTACMRKILVILNAMVRENRSFQGLLA